MPPRQTAGSISRQPPDAGRERDEQPGADRRPGTSLNRHTRDGWADDRSRNERRGHVVETRRSFDEQQQEVRSEVVKLAARSCEQIGAATHALLDADLSLVERIYANHRDIEGFVPRVEQQVYQLF